MRRLMIDYMIMIIRNFVYYFQAIIIYFIVYASCGVWDKIKIKLSFFGQTWVSRKNISSTLSGTKREWYVCNY
jgi:ABC-type dipeptide/oligopeptide/nickel transport system permease subunit